MPPCVVNKVNKLDIISGHCNVILFNCDYFISELFMDLQILADKADLNCNPFGGAAARSRKWLGDRDCSSRNTGYA